MRPNYCFIQKREDIRCNIFEGVTDDSTHLICIADLDLNDKINKKPFIKNNQKLLYFMTYIFSDKFIIHRQK